MPQTVNINTIAGWDALWETYGYRDPEQPSVIERKKAIADRIPPLSSVLDIASGASQIIQFLQPKILYVGLDFSRTALRFQEHPAICADVRQLPIKSRSFDYVIAMEILEHLERPDLFISEIFKIARKAIILSVPNNRLAPKDTKWHLRCYDNHSLALLIKSASENHDVTLHTTTHNLIAEVHK